MYMCIIEIVNNTYGGIIMDKAIVIKDQEGNFVSGRMTLTVIDNEWYYLYHTGITNGLIFYTNPERAESRLNYLQSISDRYEFGKSFSLMLISDHDIPMGETICKKIIAVEAAA